MFELLSVTLASLFAGFVDSIVGGGGLILVPALFSAFPLATPATLLGTNKAAAVCGTSWAASQYARRIELVASTLIPAAVTAVFGSAVGALTVRHVPAAGLRKLLPLMLLALLVYSLINKRLGREHQRRFSDRAEACCGALIGLVMGFYDGFFGPGTGSLLIFLFVRLLGYDFLRASAAAKLLNVATNLAALITFVSKGNIWWQPAATMAIANVGGSWLGTQLALRRGAEFVRVMFLIVVSALILRTGYDAVWR